MEKTLLERLLDYYQIDYEEYLKLISPVDLTNFYSGHQFNDISQAIDLVKGVMNNNGKILIYGDYDADGIMGTSILVKMFQYLNYVVEYYIPNRYVDGYGINLNHAQEYVDKKYNLIITVDNGITAFEPIKLLHDNNIKVLILDHHKEGDEIPLADAICHPTYSQFGNVASSGAFTAFIYSIALLNRVDKYLAVLASISLISDMMPLLEYNRNLLRAVFKEYKVGEFLAIDLLADNEKLDETIIGMRIAPRINSIGRLTEDSSINKIIEYFITDNKDYILNYYSYILEMNEERKSLSKVDVFNLGIDSKSKAIVIQGDYKEGIIGLFANSIMNKFKVPSIVFSNPTNGIIKGSARCPEGCDIVDIFAHLEDLIITSGGHALAGGCSIYEKDYPEFKKRFINYVESLTFTKPVHETIELGINELTMENYELINSFAPFGESWIAPLFKLKHIKVSTLTYSRDKKHIITSIGNRQKLVYFNYPLKEIEGETYVDAIGTIQKKIFMNSTYLEFNIKELKPSK